MKIRRTLLWLHRWVGVVAGLVILFLAITGGMLVFQHTQDRWLNPGLFPHQTGNHAPVSKALEEVARKHPDMRVQGIRLPRDKHDALVLMGGNRMIHCDPSSGAILGIRPRMGLWWQTLVKLHVNLMLGTTGGLIVEIATWTTLGLALTGLWLWWPLRIFGFRKGANFRRFNLDLHSVAGLYSSLFLIIVCITGLTMRHLHLEHPHSPGSHAPQAGARRISVDAAVHAAEAALPGARAAAVEIPPPNPHATYRI
ncbi:PepSY-associated TM helix domain-containing protein [Prosthecobacter sp.]|uniref:PepSY-associated TM helix domain-containing protein n=1 Tax=Prosthecobacter sp. TaxID=1965333 RepID=UPI0037844263